MLSSQQLRLIAACGCVALVAMIAACTKDVPTSSTTSNSSRQPAISAADAQSMSEAVSADMEGELEGVTAFGTSFGPTGFGGFAGAFGAESEHGGGCMPTVSPTPIVDSDSDRVPDSIRVTFPDCTFGWFSEADTIKGSIDIIDPTAKVKDRDVKNVFTDFARIEVEHGRERSIVLNGTREATRDSSVISQTETNFKTVYTFGDSTTATHTRNWAVIFTADVKGSILRDWQLPSGNLSVNGTSMWTHDTSTYSLTVSTNPVLHYNATCAVRPKFDSGTFKAVVVRKGVTSTVTVQFTACGQYTVTRS